jgi:nucleoside phosphorylase
MSGICGGRTGETELGALVVPDLSWNYQSGKFVDGELTADLLQVAVPPRVRAELCQLADEETSLTLRRGLMHSELLNAPIDVKPMVSGSQVVADETVSTIIGAQGRKVAGIDMEVASVLFAGHDFFDGGGIYFAAKTVVDLANPHKDDRYHEYGCALSARFVVAALSRLLSRSN